MGAGLLAALAGLATPILARVLLALGFAAVTFAGAVAVVDQLRQMVMTNVSGGQLAALQLAGLGGVWTGLGMLFGAVTFTVTMYGLTKAVRVVTGGTA